jgi:hypothetical protein
MYSIRREVTTEQAFGLLELQYEELWKHLTSLLLIFSNHEIDHLIRSKFCRVYQLILEQLPHGTVDKYTSSLKNLV